jgi:hypothetical protein
MGDQAHPGKSVPNGYFWQPNGESDERARDLP